MASTDNLPDPIQDAFDDELNNSSDEVRTFKPVDVDEKYVHFNSNLVTFRKVGNKMTSVVSERLSNGSLVNSVVTTEVTPIDEKFIFSHPRVIADKARNSRLREKATDYGYNFKLNYTASQTQPNQGRSVGEILRRMESGINESDNSKNTSFDEDLPFIDEHNWFKIGGMKVTDYSELPTKYQKAYKASGS